MEFSTELFIDEIRKKTSIWDTASEDYKNRQTKKNQWSEICLIFYPDFEGLTPKQKAETCKELQARWRNIRDAYVRYIRVTRTKSGQGRKIIKTYIYAKHLEFLKSVVEPTLTQSSFQRPENNSDNDDNDRTDDVDSNRQHVTEDTAQQEPRFSSSTCNRRKRSRLKSNLETYLDNYKTPAENDSSDDMQFFSSLLPMLKSLPLQEKMNFRIDVMKTLMEYSRKSQLPASLNFTSNNPIIQAQTPNFNTSQYPHMYQQLFQYNHPYTPTPKHCLSNPSSTTTSGSNIQFNEGRNIKQNISGSSQQEKQNYSSRRISVLSPDGFSNNSSLSIMSNDGTETTFSESEFSS